MSSRLKDNDDYEKEHFQYDGIEFPEYLTGGVQSGFPLWTGGHGAFTSKSNPSTYSSVRTLSGRDEIENRFALQLSAQCEKLLGVSIVGLEFPGGNFRASFVARLADGRRVVISRREDQHRALLEERVMSALSEQGAKVPGIWAFNGIVLVQSHEGESRLSEAIRGAHGRSSEADLLSKSLVSLLDMQSAARRANLAQFVPMMGAHEDWVRKLIDRPALLGGYFDVPAPEPDLEGIFSLLMLCDPQFVKWDSRPANAVISDDGALSWIDWEHCGARNPLDDLVHLLCDETVSASEPRDVDLLNGYAGAFAGGQSAEDAMEYVRVAGTLHFCVRLALILARAERNGWKEADVCVSEDKIGSSKEQFFTLCERGIDWSAASGKTEVLAGWFAEIRERVEPDRDLAPDLKLSA